MVLAALTLLAMCPAAGGVVVGVQAHMTQADYRSAEAFQAALERNLAPAVQQLQGAETRIVVYPEYIGSWLVAVGEPDEVFSAPDIGNAMEAVIAEHAWEFLTGLVRSYLVDDGVTGLEGHARRTIFRMKAPAALEAYVQAFSSVARNHAAYVVAGSILLPALQVSDGKATLTETGLRNVSLTFDPQGRIIHQVEKAFPIADEQPFVDAIPAQRITTFPTPAGKVGVLICADSWFPDAYAALKQAGADVVVVPSFSTDPKVWNGPWKGYSGYPNAPDVDAADVGKLSEREAWRKYALNGRIALADARYGVNTFLVGKLWDLHGVGETIAVVRGQGVVQQVKEQEAGGIVVLAMDGNAAPPQAGMPAPREGAAAPR
ncbi:MAG: nitrilase-related carbon-nitrogen hydrolase [Myxococcota bacterium]